MLQWQKRARWLVLVIAVGVVAAVFATTRRREEPAPPAAVPRVDPAAVVESSGAFLVQVKGERETVTIRADKQLSYSDGRSRLLGVAVTSVRQGKTFVALGEEATIADNQTNLEMKGNVRMRSSDGLEVAAQSATYVQNEGIVRAPGPVTFKVGRMSGSGVDFSYDETRDFLGLSDQTKVKIAAEKTGGSATDITAGSAVLARRENFVSFARAVHIVHGSQIIDADSALGDLAEKQDHLTGLELDGSARIETPDAAAGELRSIAGDVVNLAYHENSELLQSAVVAGSSVLRIAPEAGASERVLNAQNVEINMAPDGSTVTALNARDRVILELPGVKDQPSKTVRATSLVATGTAGQGLTAAVFSEGVEYTETGSAPPVKRTVTSRTLDTALNGGLGEIREARFAGSVRLRGGSGGTAANAESMRYLIETGQVELSGADRGVLPRVVNEQIAVDATRVEMTIEGSKMRAIGDGVQVRTVMLPAKPGNKEGRRIPGIMQQDRPVNGTSLELVYTGGDAPTAVFTGAARLWQGDKGETVVKGDSITVETNSGNLTARGSVISTMIVQDINPTTKERQPTTSTGQGQSMVYEDALRKITYTTKAVLVGAQGDLRADSIVVVLGANGQDVESLEAAGNVTFKEADRITVGDHLTYIASSAEYNMTGKGRLVRMLRTTAEGCRKSEGSALTFSRETDSLRIEGREETRTSTTSDTSCPPPKS